MSQIAETDFEKRRGISGVEVREGFTQVHVTNLPEPVQTTRLQFLRDIAQAGISIDFLKLTPTGASFIISGDKTDLTQILSQDKNYDISLVGDRCIVSVYAVNIRDEEGVIASLLTRIISANIPVDHVTDMHDRILVVCDRKIRSEFEKLIQKVMNHG